MKTKNKLYILFILCLLITGIAIGKSYALFESNMTASADLDVGKWVIKVNNALISDGISRTINLDDFEYEVESTIEEGYIAPGMEGYCDIIIDPTGTDVAIRYDITLNVSDLSYNENIDFSVVQVGGETAILTDEYTYSGVIELEDMESEDLITLRIGINWLDEADYDEADTLLGTTKGSRFIVPLNISVIQYLGETITPYVPPVEDDSGVSEE